MEKKLKREQRKLSRRALLAKKKGINLFEAKNYQKQKQKVAKLYEKVMNQRTDFLNKLSTEIIKNHDIICIEDLNTQGMLRNYKLLKKVFLMYLGLALWLIYNIKADWYGREIIKIGQFFHPVKSVQNVDIKAARNHSKFESGFALFAIHIMIETLTLASIF